jgi:molecular chaperone GrpE
MNKKSDDSDIVPENEVKESADFGSSDLLDDSVVAEEHATETIKKLRDKLKACEVEKLEYLTGWQRAKADLINARKRDEADRLEFIKFANERLVFDLIPVLEHWDMALNHKESWEKGDKNWRVGVESIFNQLKKVLTDNGLVELNPVGEKFDHSKHEATEYEKVDDEKKDHIILQVIQKGYSLNGKILRPAKVKVGEWKKS